MPRFKAKNSVTGEEISFEWSHDKPPTQDDVDHISEQQRTSRIATKQRVADINKQSFMEKLMLSPAAEYASKAMDVMGLNQPWHPYQGLQDVGAGMSRVIQGGEPHPETGQKPAQYPRIAGAAQAVRGALGVLGPPGEAIGLALAPEVTLPAVAAGNLTSKGVSAALPDSTPPEVRDITSTGAGLLVGGLAGHGVSRMTSPKVSPPSEAAPVTGDLVVNPPEFTPPPRPRTGVNYSYAGPGQRNVGPGAKTPPIDVNYQVMPPETDIKPSTPTDDSQVVSPSDPRTNPITPIVTPPPMPRQAGPMMPKPVPPSPMFRRTANDVAMPTRPGSWEQQNIEPPNVAPFQTTASQMQPDITSINRPEPVSNSEVSTVRPPAQRPVVPPIKPPTPPPPIPPVPPAQPVQVPPPQVPQQPMDLARAAMSRAQQPQVTPPQTAPIPQVLPVAPSSPPASVSQTPQVQPPPQTLPPQVPPQVMSPTDIAKAAMSRNAKPAAPPVEEESSLSPIQQRQIQQWNSALDFVKKRRDATVAQMQSTTGIPGDVAKLIVKRMQEQGLIKVERGKINYRRLRGEEETPETTPPEAQTAPQEQPVQANPARQQRMTDLQQQIGQAEDEGDNLVSETLRNHLAVEERNAQIEAKGTPEQKVQVKELDNTYDRIRELEDKEESEGSLNPEDTQELTGLYKKVNSIEKVLQSFIKNESGGTYEGPDANLKRGLVGRMIYNLRNLEQPGQARDVSPFSAKLRSANQVLRESGLPGAEEIGKQTPRVEDLKHKFVGTYERKAADVIKDLSKGQRIEVGRILDKFSDPERAIGFDPKSVSAAIELRDILDEIHGMFPAGSRQSGRGQVGYIPNYLTHIQKVLDSDSAFKGFMQDLWDYHLGPFKAVGDLFKRKTLEDVAPNGEGSLAGQRGVGTPRSPFVERRTGDLEDYELDVKNVLPVYIESAGKVIYDKPWMDKARTHLANIPEDATIAKELATAYLRNYARYDAYPGLQHAWDSATGRLMRVVGRSILGFDTRLFGLHAARLFSNIFPELPTKYMVYGSAKVAANPIQAYNEVGRMGILPQNIRPWFFKRPMEKVDSVTNALSIFDFIPDGVAYHGFKKMYMDRGIDAAEAGRVAADKTKDVSLRVTPARAAKFFSDDLGPLRPFTQFKQQVFKIAEQYATQPLDAVKRREYDRLARYIVGVGSMMYMHKKFHFATWHLDPFHLSSFHAAAYDRLGRILKKASDGDIEGALTDAGLLMIPGGTAIKSQYEEGRPSFVEKP